MVTISRQSLGSSDYNENYTEITGVTIESPSAYVDAGVRYFIISPAAPRDTLEVVTLAAREVQPRLRLPAEGK